MAVSKAAASESEANDLEALVAAIGSDPEEGERATKAAEGAAGIRKRHAARITKYLRLRSTDPGEAEAFLSTCLETRAGAPHSNHRPRSGRRPHTFGND